METLKEVSPQELFPVLLEVVGQGEVVSFVVAGNSMWPLMRHGRDLVFIGPCNAREVKKGDIVLLETPEGGYLLHRVMKKKGDRLLTAGDNRCRYDGELSVGCVRALVVKVKRGEHTIYCNRFYWRFLFWIWRLLFPIRGRILYHVKRYRE